MSVPTAATAGASFERSAAPAVDARPASPLRVRDFRLLFAGEGVSLVGDAFALVALPLLVLALTGDALALGAVLALSGAPRALLMLAGGALVDRFSPRRVMLASNLARLVLTALLAAATLTGIVGLPMVFAFAFAFGVADAFYLPGQSAILPRVLQPAQLAAGNALAAGVAQLAMLVGPAVAGMVIALVAGSAGVSLEGLGIAFAVDSCTFVASVAALAAMRPQAVVTSAASESMLASILSGIRYAWSRPAFRGILLLIVAVQAIIVGPFMVGVPMLVTSRLGDAAAYGVVMSAFSAGALAGMILVGVRRPSDRLLGPVLLGVASVLGIGLAALAFTTTLVQMAAVAIAIGAANGYVGILLTSWLQPRVPTALTGRVMSLVMFAMVAVVPLSSPVAGGLVGIDPTLTIAGAGLLMAAIVLAAATRRTFRDLGLVPLAVADQAG